MKKFIFASLVLCAVCGMSAPVRLGTLNKDSMIETNGVPPTRTITVNGVVGTLSTNLAFTVDGGGGVVEEADTLATVTARGGTTTNAVTFGSMGTNDVGISSFRQGAKVNASGNYSHAEGSLTTASGGASHAEGSQTTASGNYSHAEGFKSVSSNDTAFVFQGSAGGYDETPYGSHGPGTFNINPVGGLAGFWIGEVTLEDRFGLGTNWVVRTGMTGTNVFINTSNRPQAWSGTGVLTVSELTGLQPPAQVYWTLQGFSSVVLPVDVYFVGGGSWQTNMVNHFTVWKSGNNVLMSFLTATSN